MVGSGIVFAIGITFAPHLPAFPSPLYAFVLMGIFKKGED